ncbi:MAG: DNA mismatch repair endonuclease MutL [Levilactobacillus sp.]|jgi:DNA mismatch repair protein MutL|uniref:DNA mismatch repair endonuclease MutL n=1 Tax=Levilactobacillus sp. TaxID=2767919 RepID=UPI0025870964|nr:DNA mismatch repair endonuclease MutL [Levilactobacillus sp.]MCH4124282.1 DNA mismatch repair endonuclease MutL [Levilactobacillus sp.]MCI1554285.1 DNA mismatch repair endonuclease MutL [Levilactobacillus sp.]MCI1599427.1 DNA mismatch repair endonuclease MutL [Levilactobacillus sp.]
MTKIHELASVLADQIAAGEVVERPASVVKELVENAVDAHSTQIDITVEEAGLKLITVVDDGDGIADEDTEMAFKRHATSKITDRRDLFRIKSLGFRGEALPSIASVADVTLTTSTGGVGTLIHNVGGVIQEHTAAAARKGTTVTVRDLFGNVPARLKYLKSPVTELARITDIVNRLALSYPNVAFSLVHNGRELTRTTGRGDLQQVIAGIYGVQSARKMVAVNGKNPDFQVKGYVSLPELTRASRQYISLLLNGRYIHNFQLSKALIAGYGSKLMVGRYPLAVLDITMDPLLVDVNVHPTKQEVRISQEPELTQLIQETVFKRLSQENLIPDVFDEMPVKKREARTTDQLTMALNDVSAKYDMSAQHTQSVTPPAESAAPTPTPAQPTTPKPTPAAGPQPLQTPEEVPVEPVVIHDKHDFGLPAAQAFDAKYQTEQVAAPLGRSVTPVATPIPDAESAAVTAPTPPAQRFPQLRYLGQVHGTYLLAEADDGLYLIDQHAAQERVNYEFYRQAIGEVSDDEQKLLVPIVLDYPTTDVLELTNHLETLASVGIHLESFGPNSFIVHEHPTWFKAGQETDTIKEMIDWVLKDGKISVAAFREKTAIMMSCKRAIKANHHLDDQQARALLKKLATAENPFNCPHGRPVLVHFTDQDLEKLFKRIQDPHHSGDDWGE